jgi:hypothetical protein
MDLQEFHLRAIATIQIEDMNLVSGQTGFSIFQFPGRRRQYLFGNFRRLPAHMRSCLERGFCIRGQQTILSNCLWSPYMPRVSLASVLLCYRLGSGRYIDSREFFFVSRTPYRLEKNLGRPRTRDEANGAKAQTSNCDRPHNMSLDFERRGRLSRTISRKSS